MGLVLFILLFICISNSRTLCCATAKQQCADKCSGQLCTETCEARCGLFNTNCGSWVCQYIAGFSCTPTTTQAPISKDRHGCCRYWLITCFQLQQLVWQLGIFVLNLGFWLGFWRAALAPAMPLMLRFQGIGVLEEPSKERGHFLTFYYLETGPFNLLNIMFYA